MPKKLKKESLIDFDLTKSDFKKGVVKKKKVKKDSFKDLSFLSTVQIKDKWFFAHDPCFMVFSPFGRESKCSTVGIDIGSQHLGISGLEITERKHPLTTWMSLVSSPKKIPVHDSIDIMIPILLNSPSFAWFREADHFLIELQMQVNPKARMMSLALRTFCITIQIMAKKPVDVVFVHGDNKYKIAPLFCQDARDDPLREEYLSGNSNTHKRKILGEHDVRHLLKDNGEKNAIQFLDTLAKFADQVFDMTDANLIARSFYVEGMNKKKKKKII